MSQTFEGRFSKHAFFNSLLDESKAAGRQPKVVGGCHYRWLVETANCNIKFVWIRPHHDERDHNAPTLFNATLNFTCPMKLARRR